MMKEINSIYCYEMVKIVAPEYQQLQLLLPSHKSILGTPRVEPAERKRPVLSFDQKRFNYIQHGLFHHLFPEAKTENG